MSGSSHLKRGEGSTVAGRRAFSGANTLVAVHEESLTPAEGNLAAMGEHQRLRAVRLFFQHASEEAMRGTVEEIVGLRVRSFISGVDTFTDTSVKVFVFAPSD